MINFINSLSANISIAIFVWIIAIVFLGIIFLITNLIVFYIKNSIFIVKTINKNIEWLDFVISTSINTDKYIIISKENTIRICKLFNKFSLYFKIIYTKKELKNSIITNFASVCKTNTNKKILFDMNMSELYKYLD